MEAVYRVTAPIPEIGALPGDLLRADPSDPAHPILLIRKLARGVLPIVLDERVSLLALPDPARPRPAQRSAPSLRQRWRRRDHLRLVG